MKLVELLEDRMEKHRWRVGDIAKALKRSDSTVSITLAKDVRTLKVDTLLRYCSVVGLKCDLEKLIN